MSDNFSRTAYERNLLLKAGRDPDESDSGMPVEYIIGKAVFRDREFAVNPEVLIPRLETEGLVERAVDYSSEHFDGQDQPIKIADVGTGCGCIGISILLEIVGRNIDATVYLTDISEPALQIARENAVRLTDQAFASGDLNIQDDQIEIKTAEFSGSLKFCRSDLLADLTENHFQMIVANLPYLSDARISSLPGSVKNYEPQVALYGGKNGTKFINRLLDQAPDYLAEQARIVCEIDEDHELTSFKFGRDVASTIERDYFKKNRYLILDY